MNKLFENRKFKKSRNVICYLLVVVFMLSVFPTWKIQAEDGEAAEISGTVAAENQEESENLSQDAEDTDQSANDASGSGTKSNQGAVSPPADASGDISLFSSGDSTLDITWTATTGDTLTATPSSNAVQTAQLSLVYTMSGSKSAAAGDIEIRIPANIFTGTSGTTYDLAIGGNTGFAYRYDSTSNEIVLYNTREFASAEAFTCTISYDYKPSEVTSG